MPKKGGRASPGPAGLKGGFGLGEIFERPLPSVAMPFTGERLTPDYGGQTEIEHLHRYLLARHLCRGRHVLDIASGEGYGAAMLAQVAASVVGVEVADDAVAHARASYQRDNLSFLQGDARAIPLGDATVDMVVSFETIEHFSEHEQFLAEIRRVLRPGGVLCISTPDRDNYSPADRPANPFHVLELTHQEFAGLLGRHFAQVSMWWQRPMIGSVMLPGPETAQMQGGLCFERRGDRHFEASNGFARPLYLLALCSDAPLPTLPPSVYIDTTFLHVRDEQVRAQLAAEQQAATAACEALDRERGEADRLRALLAAAEAAAAVEAEQAQGRARDFERQLAAVRGSHSWAVTAPLRAIAGWLHR